MGGALVHTETKNNGIVNFISNVPFEIIPKGFILSLRNKDFSELEYYANCKSYNESEYHWNLLGLTPEGLPIVFVWGMFDKLEKVLCVTRLSIHPKWQSVSNEFLKKVIQAINTHGINIGAKHIITMTNTPNIYLRKLKGIIKQSDSVVLEVIEGVL